MPDKKISDLPLNTTPPSSSEVEINNSGTSQRTSILNILADITTAYKAEDAALQSQVTTLQTDKANLASPTFTGIPAAPTAAPATSTTQLATTAFVTTADNLKLSLTGGTMSGAIAMGTSKITGMGDPTLAQDAATKTYTDTSDALRTGILEDYDPTATAAAPTTWNGAAILKGARYYITAAGSITAGVHVLQIGDIIEARIDAAGDVSTAWAVIQGNAVASSTTVVGITRFSTDGEATSKSLGTVALTPSNLATGNFQASATFEGLIELATQAEVDTGTDTTRAVTPATLSSKTNTWKKWVGLSDIIMTTGGTWTNTRITNGQIVSRHSVANDTSIIVMDITNAIIAGGTKGFRLNSFDVIYKNEAADLDAHSVELLAVTQADSTPPSILGILISGSLEVGQDGDPRISSITVDTPGYSTYHNYILEITVDAGASSEYDFYGVQLNFDRTI